MTYTWTNWVGNQSFTADDYAQPENEAQVVDAVNGAAAKGQHVRVHATGHSFTPIVQTDGLLLDLANLSGVRSVDQERNRVVVGSGTQIKHLGDPLWDAGLGLRNQGDIDDQRIAGAISTGTHGSGTKFGSFSSMLTAANLVTASGDVVRVDGSNPDLLHAVQVSVGMLGVLTDVELQVTPRYRLREAITHESFDDVISNFHERIAENRNFGYFWFPSEESAALYNIELAPGQTATDTCYVKTFNEVDDDVPDSSAENRKVDRSYRIYPMTYDPNFHELEYFVRLDRAVDAIRELREFMFTQLPISIFPMEVRTVGAENGWLSSQYEQDTVVLSVSGQPGTDYWDYLKSVDALLGRYDARVHWGKLHFLTRDQLLQRYPKAQGFIDLRRSMDPDGMFLNDHLRPLFE